MATIANNPYQSPQALSASIGSSDQPAAVSWKQIARRWEILRLVYNLIVGLAGLLSLEMMPNLMAVSALAGGVAFGLCANVMYLLGPITEMYLNWIVDAWEGRLVPRWLAGFVRSIYLTGMLFVAGCLLSVGLTLAIGLSEMLAAGLPFNR